MIFKPDLQDPQPSKSADLKFAHAQWKYYGVGGVFRVGIYSFHLASCRKCDHTHQLKERARHARGARPSSLVPRPYPQGGKRAWGLARASLVVHCQRY